MILYYIKNTFTNVLNSRKRAKVQSALFTTLLQYELRSRKLLQLYPKVDDYLQKLFATDGANAEHDATLI